MNIQVLNQAGFARIQLNRPEKLNALSPELLTELIDVCGDIRSDKTIRVVGVEGAGKCFSAGADLPAFSRELVASPEETADLGRIATETLADLPQITMATIHGHCVGGAVVVAAACDLRIASEDSRYWIPELEAGIPLGWGGMAHLNRLVGETMAADLVLTGRHLDAGEALQSGFVSRVVPDAALEAERKLIVASILAKARFPLETTKRQLRAVRSGTFRPRGDADALLEATRDPEAGEIFKAYADGLSSNPPGS